MSAYRVCGECGAALDPGERCDCLPTTAPLKLIQPETAQVGAPSRHGQLINANFTGNPGCTVTFAREAKP